VSARNKVALVTGAARRLGSCVAQALAGHGYKMAIHHRSAKPEADELARVINAKRGKNMAAVFMADLSETAACEKLVRSVVKTFGGLDLLVNNASFFTKTPLGAITAGDIERSHSIHVIAPALMSLAAIESLRNGEPGHIINMLDIYADYPRKDFMAYTLAKAGLKSLTKQLALELAPDILVNAVAPGAILPPAQIEDADSFSKALERIPLKRFGAAGDISAAVMFLSQAEYITGHTIVVDGGRSLYI